jgi:hypothetical protein
LFSSLLLCKRIDIAWWMAIILMFVYAYFMVGSGSLKVLWMIFIEGICVEAQAPAVMVIKGATCHLCSWIF